MCYDAFKKLGTEPSKLDIDTCLNATLDKVNKIK